MNATTQTDLFENLSTAEVCTVLRTLFPSGLRLESSTLQFNPRSITERCNHLQRVAWNKYKRPHECNLDVSGVTLMNVYGSGQALLDFGNGSTRCCLLYTSDAADE